MECVVEVDSCQERHKLRASTSVEECPNEEVVEETP